MKIPIVPCPKCSGSGTVPMGRELFQTWEAIVTRKWINKEFSAGHLVEIIDCQMTTMNNRLSTLEKLGLIEFTRKDSKTLLFRRVNDPAMARRAGSSKQTDG